ncbi:hypothetical protein ABPG75_008796 [Micractinium tetrahymenae]
MADGDALQIKIRSSDGNELTFKVRGRTPFQKIFDTYGKKTGQDANLLRFVFDSQRLRIEQCPLDLDMENGDVIDAMVEQLGGGGHSSGSA